MTQVEFNKVAEKSLIAYNATYYRNNRFFGTNFWDNAEILEIIEDAFEVFNDVDYKFMIMDVCDEFLKDGEDFTKNEFNDDNIWMVIALARAFLITKKKSYADIAKHNFDIVWERAWDKESGGMFWRIENQVKNTCVTCPAVIAACLLGKIFEDESYFAKAKMALDWNMDILFDKENGKVYDKVTIEDEYDYTSYTYNQGTFIGGCCMLYEYTKDNKYLDAAKKSAQYVKDDTYHNGIMNDEDDDMDRVGFKGILARYLRSFAIKYNHPEYIEWLRKNAESAWENRNRFTLMQTKFAEKTEDKVYGAFNHSSAVSVLINSVV